MKRKVIIYSAVVFTLTCLGIMGYVIIHKMQVKKEVAAKMEQLPKFKFYKLDGTIFTNDSIPPNNPIVIIHFSTTCENCQNEAEDLSKGISMLGSTQIYMVTSSTKEEVESFMKTYKLNEYSQIIPLLDNDNTFFNSFGMALNPLVFIYDENQKLVKYYKGETKIEAIQKALKK